MPLKYALLALLFVAQMASGAVSLQLAANYDATLTTAYPNGDKPPPGCTPPSGYTEVNLGNGGGQICEQSATEFDFAVVGSNTTTNSRIAYKDAGAGDVQIETRVTDSFAGSSITYAGVGIGLRESAASTAWLFQCKSMLNGTNAIQCQHGSNGSYTNTDCSGSGTTRPIYTAVTYDVSSGDVKGFTSANGSAWLECASTNRAMSDVLGYMIGGSKSATETLTATIDNYALTATIDVYTPTDPGGGSPPTLTSAIPNQSAAQGVVFSLTFSTYFTGATSYTVSGLPAAGGLSESSDGVISGTPDADDVTASPFNVTLCGVNGDGTTCDVATFTVSAASGDTFVVGTGTSSFNCATTSGCGAGDTIQITSGARGALTLRNLYGSASSPITVRCDGAAQCVFSSGGSDTLTIENFRYVTLDGTTGWTGNTTGCGPSTDMSTKLDDCAFKLNGTGRQMLSLKGERRDATFKGVHCDGGWPGSGSTGGQVCVGANDTSYCASDHPGEWVENVIVTQSLLENASRESMYFGPNVGQACGGVAGDVLRLRNIELSWLWVEDAGWDGIEIKSSYQGSNNLHHNRIINTGNGVTGSGANSRAISCYEGSCNIYSNIVDTTSAPPGGAPGITCATQLAPTSWGTQHCEIYNNVVYDTDGNGISLTLPAGGGIANISANIYNNTVARTGGNGISVGSAVTGGGSIRDNIVAGENISISGTGFSSTNNTTAAVAAQNFVDATADDFRLTVSSPARNAATGNCPSTDRLGVSRPQGSACDQGAYEYDE